MDTVVVVNLQTEVEATCDILSLSAHSIRLVAQGSTIPFTMTRREEGRRFGVSLGGVMLETKTVP